MNKDHAVLGITADTTPDELKAQYKYLVKRHHPDLEGGNPVAFQAVQEAYKRVVERMKNAPCVECRGNGKVLRAKGFNSMLQACGDCNGTGRRWG